MEKDKQNSQELMDRINQLERENASLIKQLTERDELLTSVSLSQAIIDNSRQGIIIYDRELKYVVWNKYMEHYSGVPASSVVGKYPADIFPFLEQYQMVTKLKDILENGNSYSSELCYTIKKTGKTGWNIDFSSPLYNQANEIVGVLAIVVDITDRKKAEQDLVETKETAEENEKKYKSLFSNMMNAFGLHELIFNEKGEPVDYVFLEVNPIWEKIVGIKAETVIGKRIREIMPNIEQGWLDTYGKVVKTGIPAEYLDYNAATQKYYQVFAYRHEGNKFAVIFNDVTDKKKAEKEILREKEISEINEQKFKSMFHALQEGIYLHQVIYDEDGRAVNYRITEANPVSEQYLNIRREDAIGKTATELYQTDQPPFLDIYSKVAETGEPLTFEEYFAPMDKYFLISVFSPQKGQFATAFLDITKRKMAEQELIKAKELAEESEKLYRLLAENSSDVVWLIDVDLNFKYLSPSTQKIFGYTVEDRKDIKIEQILHPNTILQLKALIRDSIQQYTKTGQNDPMIIELEGIHKDGHSVYIEISARLILDESGNILGIQGTSRDISERKKIREQLIAAKERSEENEERLKTFINSIPDIVCYKDGEGRWLLANEADLELFCLKGVDYYGKTDLELAPYTHPIYKESFLTCMETDEKAWAKRAVSNGIEIIPTATGENRVYDVFKVPVFFSDGSRRGLAVIGRDISRLQEAQKNLLIAKEKAEESDRLKTAFLQNMSHEIRTPMNAIMGFSELLYRNFYDKAKLEKYTSIITQRSGDLLAIIDDILDISKIESGQLPVSIEPTNLQSLFEEIRLFFTEQQKKLGKKHIRFQFTLECDLSPWIIATDKVKLKQIFINLLSNAFKFTQEGNIQGGCQYEGGDQIVFYVSDTGPGISKEKQEVIFERFIQLEPDPKKGYGGTGLGLSIVKGLVALLGGKIWLDSTPGKGTTFYLSIPFNKLDFQDPAKVMEMKTHQGELNQKTILIVEDDSFNAEYIQEVLSETGAQLVIVQYGKEALDFISGQHTDLVLMDIGLPDMNGYEVSRKILSLKPGMKIIAQTAYAASGDKKKALEAGCIDYISKPIQSKILLSLISQYLD